MILIVLTFLILGSLYLFSRTSSLTAKSVSPYPARGVPNSKVPVSPFNETIARLQPSGPPFHPAEVMFRGDTSLVFTGQPPLNNLKYPFRSEFKIDMNPSKNLDMILTPQERSAIPDGPIVPFSSGILRSELQSARETLYEVYPLTSFQMKTPYRVESGDLKSCKKACDEEAGLCQSFRLNNGECQLFSVNQGDTIQASGALYTKTI